MLLSFPSAIRPKNNHSGLRLSTLAFTLLAASLLTGTSPAQATDAPSPATITMSGEGRISVAPDMAVVTTRVVTAGKTAPEALSENTGAMNDVIAKIKTSGIEARDVQTSGFSIYPRYEDRRNNPDKPLRIIGYEVTNGVTIQIRDLEKLGSILDTVVRSGANEVNGISFRVSDPEDKLDAARKAATETARAKAELYSTAAGAKLGRILTITETGVSIPRPFAVRSEKMMMADAAPVPMEAGQETLSAHVTITWELEQ
ncbi:SIMPL domain-containing protein [Roseibium sp.]|uniref:SIMPL domain-containing protein n=1 Tax=Roseibium sp. TaxID=1936156 RepID=UPI003A96F7C9